MFNTLGERITYCRNLLYITRHEMAKKLTGHISLPTLARWELNTVFPSLKKIQILTNFFLQEGINVSAEWIKDGVGYPPLSIDLEKLDGSQFDELVYSSLVNIRNKVKNFYFSQINSNFFKPIVSFGDYVGGTIEVEKNKKILDRKLCFLFSENIITAGIYNYEKDALSNLDGELHNISDSNNSVNLGEVQWIIRRP